MINGTLGWRALRSLSWLGTALGALLVPKCPLCVAAALSLLGVNAVAASSAAPLIRPLSFAVSVAFLLCVLRSERRSSVLRRLRVRKGNNRSCCESLR
ncbi:MAG TPA: hypothetical protein VF294_00660 [Polyangiaceae bacterium]